MFKSTLRASSLIYSALFYVFAYTCFSQEIFTQWSKTFGGSEVENANCIYQTSDGGYILFGTSYVQDVYGDLLVKTDDSGNLVWSKNFISTIDAYDVCGQQTSDGGYIFCGTRWRPNSGQEFIPVLVKIDASGNLVWSQEFDDDKEVTIAYSVQQTSDGGYIISGSENNGDFETQHGFLIKTNALGEKIWRFREGQKYRINYSYDVRQTSDGGYIMCGKTQGPDDSGYDALLIKADSFGATIWEHSFGDGFGDGSGGSQDDRAFSVQQTSDGGYILCGSTQSYGAGSYDAWLLKTDSAGNLVWQQTFGGTNADDAQSVQQTSDGGYILCGSTQSYGAGGSDAWLIKVDDKIVLKRQLPNGTIEIFQVGKHGWQFGNTAPNMWPQSWWSQFNYSQSPYPLAWLLWPISARSQDFPDWPLFVKAFGEDQCYLNSPPDPIIYRPSAVNLWSNIKGNWGGSCFGFAVSTFLAFDNKTTFLQEFPGVGDFNYLYDLAINDSRRETINQLWIQQFGASAQAHRNANWHKTPIQTLAEIKQMFLSTTRNDRHLDFFSQHGSGGHSVNPYKIVKSQTNPNMEEVYIYDNNAPGDLNRKITINTDPAINTWHYSAMPTWGGNEGLFLMDPSSNYLNTPILSKKVSEQRKLISFEAAADEYIEFFNSPDASIAIYCQNGITIGYSDSMAFNHFDDGIPIIPITGSFHPPIGYFIPNDAYHIVMQNFSDTASYFSVFSDSVVYSYSRHDALPLHTDEFRFGDGFIVKNPDNDNKMINLLTIIKEADNEKLFEIDSCEVDYADSVRVKRINSQALQIINYGSEKNYNLSVRFASANTDLEFKHNDILLSANTSQLISPAWRNFPNMPIQIFIDEGINGTIDDTLFVQNRAGSMTCNFAQAGWQMISSYVIPTDPELPNLLDHISSNLVIMKDGNGQVYWPAYSIDQIGNWKIEDGYQIYLSGPDTLLINGYSVIPESTPINLSVGWNMSSYLRNNSMATETALASISANLVIAKNGAGQVYWPAYSINTIGDMRPGQGYQIYVTAATTLTYPANDVIPKAPALAAHQAPIPVHYTSYRTITGNNAILLISTPYLPEGSEVGVWTATHLLIGSGVVHQGRALLTLWGDDTMTQEVDGAIEREPLALTCWPPDQNREFQINCTAMKDGITQKVVSSLEYSRNAVWLAETDATTGMLTELTLPTEFGLTQNYPNPFNSNTTIKYQLPREAIVELILYNLSGVKVRTFVNGIKPAGFHEVIWNGRDDNDRLAPSGVYWLKMKAGDYEKTLKMSLIK